MAFRPTLSALRVRLDAAADRHERAVLKLVLELAATLPLTVLEELRTNCPAAQRELNTRHVEALRDYRGNVYVETKK